MPLTALTGSRLRERRLAAGLRQSDVAAAAGISASYLNLIEHNRRKVTPDVLERLADALAIDRAALAGAGNAAVVEDLRAAAARGTAQAELARADLPRAEVERVEEFADRFPGWAGLLVALETRTQSLERAVEALNDRMTHDPHLSAALHELLSSLSAVRATAAILAETPDLEPDWATRFHRNLHQDSERLAAGAEALVAYLDSGNAIVEQGIASPQEEVESWLASQGWRPDPDSQGSGEPGDLADLASTAARSLARAYLHQAAQDVAALPDRTLADGLARHGPDAFLIAQRTSLDPILVMRRLATWPELQAGLVICDASGTLTFRKPAAGFPLPRFGAACPLWPLYAALGRPFQPVDRTVSVAGQGDRVFRVLAWARPRQSLGLRGPDLNEAAMLILPAEAQARRPDSLAIGSTCRICPRQDCPARREPTILTEDPSSGP